MEEGENMLKKLFARLGKGAATVDLRLHNPNIQGGQTIQGELVIQGGEVTQSINNVSVAFMMDVTLKQGPTAQQIALIPISGRDTISPGETKTIPFNYAIPADLPVSRNHVSYYFHTNVDIEGGIDRKDVDRINILPSTEVQALFDAMQLLDFREKATSGKMDAYGQEFAFFPTSRFQQDIQEVELRVAKQLDGVRVWMEVDCRNGFREIEAKREFMIPFETLQDVATVKQLLEDYISETIQNPTAYLQPFSFQNQHYQKGMSPSMGSAIPGMIGGLAVGVLGSILISEMLDGLMDEEMMEEATGEFEEATEEFEDMTEDFGDFDDF